METNLPDALLRKPYTAKLKFEVSHCVCSCAEIKVNMGGQCLATSRGGGGGWPNYNYISESDFLTGVLNDDVYYVI